MKKITLSAAIVALAMMGCSDAGLDNSVASTSEIKSEQVQSSANEPLVLAKSNYVNYDWPTHALTKQEPLQKVGPENLVYHSYDTGIKLDAGTWVDQGSNNGVGWFKMQREGDQISPDYIRILTLPLYNCGWKVKDQLASCVTNYNYLKVDQTPSDVKVDEFRVETDTDLIFHPSQGYEYRKQNVMTYYIAVWSENQWNQVILAGTIYNGNQLKNNRLLAEKVYEQVFIPTLNEYIAHH
jgi:hypothetical protein